MARVMKVERGRVTPRVFWMRSWTCRTEEREMGMAILVSVGGLGVGSLGALGGDGSMGLEGTALMLLRSRWPSLVMRADCSEG